MVGVGLVPVGEFEEGAGLPVTSTCPQPATPNSVSTDKLNNAFPNPPTPLVMIILPLFFNAARVLIYRGELVVRYLP